MFWAVCWHKFPLDFGKCADVWGVGYSSIGVNGYVKSLYCSLDVGEKLIESTG